MLHSFHDLRGYAIHATDRDVGKVRDLYFDDQSTAIRYIVVDTGGWLSGRRVLLAPAAIGGIDAQGQSLTTGLTRQQIEDSPGIDRDRPVSRQEEIRLHEHFGWDPYWLIPPTPAGIAPYWGGAGLDAANIETRPDHNPHEEEALADEQASGDPHLRSASEVRGYQVHAVNGEVGTVDDFLIEPERWSIAFLVADTGSWLASRPVLLPPDWVRGIDWAGRQIEVDVDREQIRSSPDYQRGTVVDQAYQERLFAHYGRPPLA